MDLRGFRVDGDDDYEAVMQYCIAFDLNNSSEWILNSSLTWLQQFRCKTDVTPAIFWRNFVVQFSAHVAHCDESHKWTKQTLFLVTLMMILLQSVYSIN